MHKLSKTQVYIKKSNQYINIEAEDQKRVQWEKSIKDTRKF